MRDAARELNRGFFRASNADGRGCASSSRSRLDGRTALANGESKWITGEAARADVQRWRARSSALLTGSGTVLADDPQLTVRSRDVTAQMTADHSDRCASCSIRVCDFPVDRMLLDGSAPTLLIHGVRRSTATSRTAASSYAAVETRDGRLDLPAVTGTARTRGINELQVEAGATLCGALLEPVSSTNASVHCAELLGDTAQPLLALTPFAAMAAAAAISRRRRPSDRRGYASTAAAAALTN